MRLVEYIKTGRGETITRGEAMRLVSDKYSDSYHGDARIYRGVSGYGDYAFINPSTSNEPRVSANTTNYYTLIMDNTPQWKKYPKRSKSLICSTEKEYAKVFGVLYRVYPINGSKIGVCPKADIWPSNAGNSEYSFELINDRITSITTTALININKADNDYDRMIQAFDKIDKNKDKLPSYFDSEPLTFNFVRAYINSGLTLLKFIEKLMNPEKCGFQLIKAGQGLQGKHEVWTDEPCVLVKEGTPILS